MGAKRRTGRGQAKARKAAGIVETGLTHKEELFAHEYAIDGIAWKAACRAGVKQSHARSYSAGLLRKPLVQKRIQELKELRFKRIEVTADRVLEELRRIGYSDLRDVLSWRNGSIRVRNSTHLADDAAVAIAEVALEEHPNGKRTTKIKMHKKEPALALLAKHVGLIAPDDDGVDPEVKAQAIKAMLDAMDARTGGPTEPSTGD
jgi:phage terminase small subunit